LYSSGLSFAAPDAGEVLGKWLGGFAEGTDVTAASKSGGNGVVYCLKTFVARACVRTVVAELAALTSPIRRGGVF
jgi:hypothetical protein